MRIEQTSNGHHIYMSKADLVAVATWLDIARPPSSPSRGVTDLLQVLDGVLRPGRPWKPVTIVFE